ncbi:hypothetical protein UJ101_00878 [Flavobacteriaceae bacterium UJ101]|nr:hypothetical protein UJ101_00878 [Flavobacteriaceae bacterium UJ101]
MININRAYISKVTLHRVGHKVREEKNIIAENLMPLTETLDEVLKNYFLNSFKRENTLYQFTHHADLSLNEVYNYCKEVFEDESLFLDASQNILNALYEQSTHPSIKLGELFVVHFGDIAYQEQIVDAIGIFKVERKNKFFKFINGDEGLELELQNGFSIQKLDKGALVLNIDEGSGLKVLSIDNNNYDAAYWKKHFLKLEYVNNNNFQTDQYLELCTNFSDSVIANDYGKEKQTEFLGNTLRYFNDNPMLEDLSFKEEVLGENKELLEAFNEYKEDYSEANEVQFWDSFEVAQPVYKSKRKKIKTEIKLDTKIKIILDNNSLEEAAENIEKGFDDTKKMNYYKVYFDQEME